MVRIIIGALLAITLSGCTRIDKAPGESRYGPANEEAQLGEASYTVGPSMVMKSRRDDTYKKMYESCGGKYRIVDEVNTGQDVKMKYKCI